MLERLSEDETAPTTYQSRTDAASRELWVTEAWIRIDEDGDGVGDTKLPWKDVDYYPLVQQEQADGQDEEQNVWLLPAAIGIVLLLIILIIVKIGTSRKTGQSSDKKNVTKDREPPLT